MNNERRRFFSSIFTTISGSVLLSLSNQSNASVPRKDEKEKITSKGYQETDHVKTYYKHTNF